MAFFKNHITPGLLANEPVWKLLLRFSLPAIIATSATSLYNLTDSIFIGRGVGPMAMAGLGVALPIMNIVSAFGSMVGVGAAALFSLRLGRSKHEADEVLSNVVLLNFIIAVLVALVGLFLMEPLLRVFGASDDVIVEGVVVSQGSLGYAKIYLRILLFGNLITNMYLSLNELLRVSGYPHKAMFIMLSSVLLNGVLDGLFIFVFKWGIAGSACSTIVSQAIALLVVLSHFAKKTSFVHFASTDFGIQRRTVGAILHIGSASFLLHFCTSIVVFFVNRALAPFGDLYIGAYSVVNRMVMLFVMIVAGLNQGMQPIVGYNYGAKNYQRVLSALKLTMVCAFAVMSAGCVLGVCFPEYIAALFVDIDSTDAENLVQTACFFEIIVNAVRVVFVAFPLVGCQIVISNFFQYIGKSYLSMFLSLTRQLLFLIPLLLILPNYFASRGVWMSIPIADGTASVLAIVVLLCFLFRMEKSKRAELR